MRDADLTCQRVEGGPEAEALAPHATGPLVGIEATGLAPRIVARPMQSCIARAHRRRANAHPEEDALVGLAEDLQAAIASNDIRLAREAHGALGRQLQGADLDERVVDLARERAQRRRPR